MSKWLGGGYVGEAQKVYHVCMEPVSMCWLKLSGCPAGDWGIGHIINTVRTQNEIIDTYTCNSHLCQHLLRAPLLTTCFCNKGCYWLTCKHVLCCAVRKNKQNHHIAVDPQSFVCKDVKKERWARKFHRINFLCAPLHFSNTIPSHPRP